jgi:Spy/CpxP family protein refolding chaperone
MKTSRKILVTALVGSLMIGGAGAALAYGGPGMGGPGMGGPGTDGCMRGGMTPAVMQLPGLTQEQRSQLDALRQEQQAMRMERRQAMQAAQRELRDAVANGADQATIQAIADKIGAHKSAAVLARVEAWKRRDAVLTEQQREQLQAMMEQRRGYRMGPPHMGHHRGWGW